MILIFIISILLIAGLLCWMIARQSPVFARWIALLAVLVDLVLIFNTWLQQRSLQTTNEWFIDYKLEWIPAFGISFHLALDGLSTVMLLLTFFLGTLSVLCSWTEIKQRTGFYYFKLLWTLAGISGGFVGLDRFVFYFLWEVVLIGV